MGNNLCTPKNKESSGDVPSNQKNAPLKPLPVMSIRSQSSNTSPKKHTLPLSVNLSPADTLNPQKTVLESSSKSINRPFSGLKTYPSSLTQVDSNVLELIQITMQNINNFLLKIHQSQSAKQDSLWKFKNQIVPESDGLMREEIGNKLRELRNKVLKIPKADLEYIQSKQDAYNDLWRLKLPTEGSDLKDTLLKEIDVLSSDSSVTAQNLTSKYHQISDEIAQYHEFTMIRENIKKFQERLEDSIKKFNTLSFKEVFKNSVFNASKDNALLCILLINIAFLNFIDVILFLLTHYRRDFKTHRSKLTYLGPLFKRNFQMIEDRLISACSSNSEIGLYFYATMLQGLYFDHGSNSADICLSALEKFSPSNIIEKYEDSPLGHAILILKTIFNTELIYRSELIKICTLIRLKSDEIAILKQSSTHKEHSEEDVDFYKAYLEDLSQTAIEMLKKTCEIMKNGLPSRILALGDIPSLNGLTFINGDIGIRTSFLDGNAEEAVVRLVIVLLHELIHKVRFTYSASGNYLNRTPEKCENEIFGREAGLYLTKKLFGITFEDETHFELIDENMIKLILDPNMWVKDQLYQIGEQIKFKTPPTLNKVVKSNQHNNHFVCYHQIRDPMISSFDAWLNLPSASL